MAVEPVVGTINIDPAAEHMGFAVGSVFPSGKIGVESLHTVIPPDTLFVHIIYQGKVKIIRQIGGQDRTKTAKKGDG